jgi:hypothetical protein
MRVVRERLAQQGRLAAVYRAAASILEARTAVLAVAQDRVAVRGIPEQVTALLNNIAGSAGKADKELTALMLRLRLRALHFLNELGDGATRAIAIASR